MPYRDVEIGRVPVFLGRRPSYFRSGMQLVPIREELDIGGRGIDVVDRGLAVPFVVEPVADPDAGAPVGQGDAGVEPEVGGGNVGDLMTLVPAECEATGIAPVTVQQGPAAGQAQNAAAGLVLCTVRGIDDGLIE